MIKKSVLSILAATAILTMSGCGAEDAVKKAVESAAGTIIDQLPDGSGNYTATDLGNRSFKISFDIEQGMKYYSYSINSSETDSAEGADLLNGFYSTSTSDTLNCVPKNEQSFVCTSNNGIPYTLTPNPELYLHKTTIEIDADDAFNPNTDYEDVTNHSYKIRTITVDGLVAK